MTENKQIIGLRRFLGLIKSALVPPESALLLSDNFLMGLANDGADYGSLGRKGFFILLKFRSIADVFDSLREWERKMFSDLRGFIGAPISSETNYLFTKDFDDGIVENKNARILYDKEGEIVLMYVFVDDRSVVITNSRFAAKEILARLTSREKGQ